MNFQLKYETIHRLGLTDLVHYESWLCWLHNNEVDTIEIADKLISAQRSFLRALEPIQENAPVVGQNHPVVDEFRAAPDRLNQLNTWQVVRGIENVADWKEYSFVSEYKDKPITIATFHEERYLVDCRNHCFYDVAATEFIFDPRTAFLVNPARRILLIAAHSDYIGERFTNYRSNPFSS